MPDLGKYAFEVLTAYGVSLILLTALIWWSLRKARIVHRELKEIEARHNARD